MDGTDSSQNLVMLSVLKPPPIPIDPTIKEAQ